MLTGASVALAGSSELRSLIPSSDHVKVLSAACTAGAIEKASIRIGDLSTLLADKEMRWLELSEMM